MWCDKEDENINDDDDIDHDIDHNNGHEQCQQRFKWIWNDNNESRVLLLSYIHTDDAVKMFLIPLQGLFGMSKGSLHVSHIYVRTDAANSIMKW